MSKSKTIGFFGGSFNPPHLGHTLAAVYAKEHFDLDEIWFAPVYEHAFGKQLISFEARIALVRLACKGLGKNFKVSSIEKKLQDGGKTLLTLRALKKKYPAYSFKLIIGSDAWQARKKWYQFSNIQKEFGVCVVPRGSSHQGFSIPDVSSTMIRKNSKSTQARTWMSPHVLKEYQKLVEKAS